MSPPLTARLVRVEPRGPRRDGRDDLESHDSFVFRVEMEVRAWGSDDDALGAMLFNETVEQLDDGTAPSIDPSMGGLSVRDGLFVADGLLQLVVGENESRLLTQALVEALNKALVRALRERSSGDA